MCVCVCVCVRVCVLRLVAMGFLGHSAVSFLSKIGITGHSLKSALHCLQTTVQHALSWIWS